MFSIALRNLVQEKGRLLISVAGVAFSILLVITMLGIYNGVIAQFTQFITKNPTDLVVSKKGIMDFYHGSSLIPVDRIADFRNEPGVKDVVPMISQRSEAANSKGDKFHIFIASYDPAKPQGAPWQVTGTNAGDIKDDEIIISDTLASKIDKKVGDVLRLGDFDLKIVGLIHNASSLGTHYTWVNRPTAEKLTQLSGIVNFLYLTLDNPSEAQAVASRLETKYPDFATVTKATFTTNGEKEISESFLPIVKAIAVIALIIGIAIIGLTIYTATIDKSKEYGILKAIGLNGWQLFQVVLAQSIIMSAVGLVIGILAALGLASILEAVVNVRPAIPANTIYWVAAAGITMGILASFLPVKRINSIDPAEVFKS